MAHFETTKALIQLEAELKRANAPIVSYFADGLPEDEITLQLETAVGITIRPELQSWYGWKNGTTHSTTTDGPSHVPTEQLVGNWFLPSLSQAIAFHNRRYTQVRAMGWPQWWPDGWFPLLESYDGIVLCVDTAHDGELFIIDSEADLPADPPEPQSPSLADFALTYVSLLCDQRENPVIRLTGLSKYW